MLQLRWGKPIRLNIGKDNSLDDGEDFPWITALSLGNGQLTLWKERSDLTFQSVH